MLLYCLFGCFEKVSGAKEVNFLNNVFLQEKQRMTDKLEDTSLRLNDEMDLYRKIMDKLWHNRHEFQKEKEAMQEVRGRGGDTPT